MLDEPDALERFRREVKLARRVTNRNVGRTFDIGETGERKFLTMEFIDGPSLAQVIHERGGLAVAEAVRVALAIAEALAAAHAAGVIHRDLKPDNVLLARDGRIVDAVYTEAGMIIGTLARVRATCLFNHVAHSPTVARRPTGQRPRGLLRRGVRSGAESRMRGRAISRLSRQFVSILSRFGWFSSRRFAFGPVGGLARPAHDFTNIFEDCRFRAHFGAAFLVGVEWRSRCATVRS